MGLRQKMSLVGGNVIVLAAIGLSIFSDGFLALEQKSVSLPRLTDDQNANVDASAALFRTSEENRTTIVDQPLFHADRMFHVRKSAPAQAVPPPRAPWPDFELIGVFETGSRKFAMLRSRGQNRSQKVQLGETVQGWTLAEIDSTQIVLTAQDERRTLAMKKAGQSQNQGNARHRPSGGQRGFDRFR